MESTTNFKIWFKRGAMVCSVKDFDLVVLWVGTLEVPYSTKPIYRQKVPTQAPMLHDAATDNCH